MQNLNIEFTYEEIKQSEILNKLQINADKQLLFFCPEDYPDIKKDDLTVWAKNNKLVLIKRSDLKNKLIESFEVIDILESKGLLQNQILKIFKKIKDTGSKEEINETLSDREKKVMRELVLGFTNKEIADRLYISPHTVIAHRKNITGKLGIKSVPGLTIYAFIHKIISEEDIKRATKPSDPDSHK